MGRRIFLRVWFWKESAEEDVPLTCIPGFDENLGTRKGEPHIDDNTRDAHYDTPLRERRGAEEIFEA